MVSLCYCGYHLTPFWSCVHCQAPHFSEEWKHINRGLVLYAHAQHLKIFQWFCCKAREPSPWSVSWRMVPMLRHSGDPRLTCWPFFPTRPTLEKHPGPPIAVKMRWGLWKSSATSLKFEAESMLMLYLLELYAGHICHDLCKGLGDVFNLVVQEYRLHYSVPFKSFNPVRDESSWP